jgi:nicotinamidase-related amidase
LSGAGWEIIPELAVARRTDHRQAGQGSFCATDLELILRQKGIDNIVRPGSPPMSVHTTMRGQ